MEVDFKKQNLSLLKDECSHLMSELFHFVLYLISLHSVLCSFILPPSYLSFFLKVSLSFQIL
jgi:hypothetical protein